MPDIAAIDGITGPGKRVTLINEASEISFKLKKKVVEVTNKDGSFGSYDLAQAKTVTITSDGTDLILSVTSKEPEDDHGTTKTESSTIKPLTGPKSESTGTGPGKTETVPKR